MKKPIIPLALAGGVMLVGTMNQHEAAAAGSVEIARKQLHAPYEWGKNDCSGFTKQVFAQLGIDLPHSSVLQAGYGTPVSKNRLHPGDLVFFNTSGKGISHVGIYVGGGRMISSENERTGVRETEIFGGGAGRYWEPRFVTGRRLEREKPGRVKMYVRAVQTPPVHTENGGQMQREGVSNRITDYTVRQGDTLSAISQRTHVSVAGLKAINGLHANLIRPGQVLKLHKTAEKKNAKRLSDKMIRFDSVMNAGLRQTRTIPRQRIAGRESFWAILAEHGITVLKFQKLSHGEAVRLFPGQKLHVQ